MRRTGLIAGLTVIILILLAGVGYTIMRRGIGLPGSVYKDSGSNVSDYSAVFLTNGQVYFGKLYSPSSDTTIDLRDIYYLQVNQQIQPDQKAAADKTAQQPQVTLVKLGDELHGPADRMQINHDQVLFTESLKSDSKVITAIGDYQKNKK
jgi:hypothetical protein